MRVITDTIQFDEFYQLLRKRATGYSPRTVRRVKKILDDVKERGDEAVREYTKQFDSFPIKSLRIAPKKVENYAKRVDKTFMGAIRVSAGRIRRFHEKQKEETWTYSQEDATLGQIIRPLERIGVYVPGGKASYPSTVLMNVIPAQIAGVREIIICVPTPFGEINPYVMATIHTLGVKEVYSIGGAQAIGAMAFGTESIRKVDKIVGPGNIYVALAKRLVFGEVDIDMIAGPSEILIIADRTGEPSFIASDLLSQAEHDEMASSILMTTSRKLMEKVKREINRQLEGMKRKDIARKSLNHYGALILAKSMKKAFDYANLIAPEHLEIMTENPMEKVPLAKNAGAIFLGRWTPEPVGDYSAGPNHTLPTGGTSRFFSPLGVYDFMKKSSLLYFTRKGFHQIANTVEILANTESLEAHANTIKIRRKSNLMGK